MKKSILVSISLLLAFWALPASAMAQCFECGDGTDGAFNATVNDTIAGGVYNFTSFSIAPGVTIRVTGSQPLQIKATGAVDIQGTLDVSGLAGANGVTFTGGGAGAIGVAGGGNGGGGAFSANTGPLDGIAGSGSGSGGFGSGWSGGGGAGHASTGSSSGNASGGFGGMAYGSPAISLMDGGSGGGGGSGGYNCGGGGGGAGGGYVSIFSCTTIQVTGTITAKGGNGGSDDAGNCGGGGGGSGGAIWLAASQVINNGMVLATGGQGGASAVPGTPYFGTGANGSQGRIRVDAGTMSGAGTYDPASGFSAQPLLASITFSQNITCFGGSDGGAIATVTGGTGTLTYAWSPGGGNTLGTQGLAANCYTFTATDSLGCTAIDSICLTEPPVLGMAFSNTVQPTCFGSCDGASMVTASGGTPGYAYLWSNGSTQDQLNMVCAGGYAVTITDSVGCLITDSILFSQPAPIALSETHQDATTGSSTDGSATVTAMGGTPPYSYAWVPNVSSTSSASNLAAGTYLCLVTDTNGCMDSIEITIGVLIGTDNALDAGLELYPNPTSGNLVLRLGNLAYEQGQIEVYELSGKRVFSQNLAGNNGLPLEFDFSKLAEGGYLLKLQIDGMMATRKLSIVR